MRLFFFGTLLDADVLALVLGREPPAADRQAATLRGYRRLTVADETYPVLHPQPGASVTGTVIDQLDEEQVRRACFFEDDEFELRPQRVELATGGDAEALTFMPTVKLELSDQPWELAAWQAEHKADFMPMARDWMAGYGHAEPAELEGRWQQALRRLRRT